MKMTAIKIIFTSLILLVAQSIYTASGFLKLVVNMNPNKYKVNVQGYGNISRYVRFLNGQDAKGGDFEFEADTLRDPITGKLTGLDFMDYEVPKGKDNGRLFVFVYDRATNKRLGAASILDLDDSRIQIEWSEGKADRSTTTISSKDHNVAFRVIVKEDGTITLAE
jgi:hypothetical protein